MKEQGNGCAENKRIFNEKAGSPEANLLPVLNTRIVGISSDPTLNRVTIESGETWFVHCGADILLSGLLQDLEGEALCPVCGRTTQVGIRSAKIKSLEPPEAILHYLRFKTADPGRFGIVCESTFLFDKKDCLNAWRESYAGPAGIVATPQEFLSEVWLIRRQKEIRTW